MSKIISFLVKLIAIISLYLVIVVGFKIEPLLLSGLDNSRADQINIVIVNLSCSYISGYLVYFLTVLLPIKNKKEKIAPIINEKLRKIENSFEIVMTSFFSVLIPKSLACNKDLFISKIERTPLHSTYTEESEIIKRKSLLEILCSCRDDVKRSIDEILIYREYISLDEIQLLESMKYSNCFYYTNLITKSPSFDVDIIRKDLGEDLFNWYEKIKVESQLSEESKLEKKIRRSNKG